MGLRVGITIVGREPGAAPANVDAALWSSGIAQNIVFLAMLLQRLPEIDLVVLVACPGGAEDHPFAARFGLPCLNQDQCADHLDLLIELGARAHPEPLAALRTAGGKLVSYVAGNVMAMNFEAVACQVSHGEIMSAAPFDAVWITPQHWDMVRSYAALTRSQNVSVTPHLWTPRLLIDSAARSRSRLFWRPPPRGEPLRLGVFDPNMNVLKTFHLPLLVCEEAYRRRPDAIGRVLLFSADHLKGHRHVEEFCAATDLGRAGRIFLESRFPLAEVLGPHVDIVVTHQWQNNLNYLYWDALYAGYPLIHNTTHAAVGYPYRDFDPQDGARAVCDAIEHHAARRQSARSDELEVLWQFHIDNPAVQNQMSAQIAAVMS
jgi:hypothetical protein